MLINLKKINFNVVIGILLILVIIYILYNKKQEIFIINPTLSPKELLDQKLEELVAICFDVSQEPDPKTIETDLKLTNEFLTANSKEVYDKLDELILPALYSVSKLLKITAIDLNCGNSEDDSSLNNTVGYLLKIVKSLAIVFHEILDILYDKNTSLPSLNFDDMELVKQIDCLRKKNLPYDDTILNEYDLDNTEVNENSSLYTFSIKLLEFIYKIASGIPPEECLDVDLTQKSNLPSKYIYFDGVERQCNPPTEPPTISPTLPPTGSATLSPTGSTTLPPTGLATLSPTGLATLSPTLSSDTTLTGYDSGIFGSSYSNITPAPNNLPRGINLINSQGPNNFFLPNIRIS